MFGGTDRQSSRECETERHNEESKQASAGIKRNMAYIAHQQKWCG